MVIGTQALEILAIAGVATSVVSLTVALRASARLTRIRRGIRVQGQRVAGEMTLVPEEFAKMLESLAHEVDLQRAAGERAVQGVGVVRFDAFEDMGGHLSFSAALLDARGSGLVLTSINGRQETRIYAKPVEGAASRYNLSEEEQEAIRRALAPR